VEPSLRSPDGSNRPGTNALDSGAQDACLASAPETRTLFGPNYERAAQFAELLRREGEVRGLIGPSEANRIWDRHVLNSAALLEYLPDHGFIADLGSGAGLPGIVLAIARPSLSFTLIEPMERRVNWLREIQRELAIANVQILNSRVEEVRDRAFDQVTARAVASAGKLVSLSFPVLKPGGTLLALKGRNVGNEIAKAEKQFRRLGITDVQTTISSVVPGSTETTVLQIRKPR